MKALLITTLSLLIALSMPSADIIGIWKVEDQDAQIEIKEVKGEIVGQIVKSEKEKAIGKTILRNIEKKKGFYTAELYSFKQERWFDAEITPKKEQLEIEVSAGWASKTVYWNKVK